MDVNKGTLFRETEINTTGILIPHRFAMEHAPVFRCKVNDYENKYATGDDY